MTYTATARAQRQRARRLLRGRAIDALRPNGQTATCTRSGNATLSGNAPGISARGGGSRRSDSSLRGGSPWRLDRRHAPNQPYRHACNAPIEVARSLIGIDATLGGRAQAWRRREHIGLRNDSSSIGDSAVHNQLHGCGRHIQLSDGVTRSGDAPDASSRGDAFLRGDVSLRSDASLRCADIARNRAPNGLRSSRSDSGARGGLLGWHARAARSAHSLG